MGRFGCSDLGRGDVGGSAALVKTHAGFIGEAEVAAELGGDVFDQAAQDLGFEL